jgi:hypothetical protein
MGEARRRRRLDPDWGRVNKRSISDDQGREMVAKILNNPKNIMLMTITHAMVMRYMPYSKYIKED